MLSNFDCLLLLYTGVFSFIVKKLFEGDFMLGDRMLGKEPMVKSPPSSLFTRVLLLIFLKFWISSITSLFLTLSRSRISLSCFSTALRSSFQSSYLSSSSCIAYWRLCLLNSASSCWYSFRFRASSRLPLCISHQRSFSRLFSYSNYCAYACRCSKDFLRNAC